MLEDFTKYALKSPSQPKDFKISVYLMRVVPSLMNPGFVSVKTKDAIVRSLRSL
jgi:hypothetical protein